MEAKPAAQPKTEAVAPVATSTATTTTVPPARNAAINSAPATQQTATTAAPSVSGTVRFVPSKEYTVPDPSNPVVNNFDMQHLGLINENPIAPAFIKCRAYFVEGTRQAAIEIEKILDGENVVNGLKKSERIANLCSVLKSEK